MSRRIVIEGSEWVNSPTMRLLSAAMAREGHMVALHDASELLGVSVAQLEQRIEAGELPEAVEDDQGSLVIEREQLSAIAQREGWIIDLREEGDGPSPEFSEMLERLLGLGQQLIEETSARQVAEAALERAADDLVAAKREVHELDLIIEELDVENMKLGNDLNEATQKMRVSDAIAKERFETILDLQAAAEAAKQEREVELERLRRSHYDLRDRADKAMNAMGWWSRRRFHKT